MKSIIATITFIILLSQNSLAQEKIVINTINFQKNMPSVILYYLKIKL
jgi:hypothetical protein